MRTYLRFLHEIYLWCMLKSFTIKSMASHKTAVTTLLTHWSYYSLAISHCNAIRNIQRKTYVAIKKFSHTQNLYTSYCSNSGGDTWMAHLANMTLQSDDYLVHRLPASQNGQRHDPLYFYTNMIFAKQWLYIFFKLPQWFHELDKCTKVTYDIMITCLPHNTFIIQWLCV